MLNLRPLHHTDCQSPSRRSFLLQVGALGGIGLSLDQALRGQAAAAAPRPLTLQQRLEAEFGAAARAAGNVACLLYTSPSPRD